MSHCFMMFNLHFLVCQPTRKPVVPAPDAWLFQLRSESTMKKLTRKVSEAYHTFVFALTFADAGEVEMPLRDDLIELFNRGLASNDHTLIDEARERLPSYIAQYIRQHATEQPGNEVQTAVTHIVCHGFETDAILSTVFRNGEALLDEVDRRLALFLSVPLSSDPAEDVRAVLHAARRLGRIAEEDEIAMGFDLAAEIRNHWLYGSYFGRLRDYLLAIANERAPGLVDKPVGTEDCVQDTLLGLLEITRITERPLTGSAIVDIARGLLLGRPNR